MSVFCNCFSFFKKCLQKDKICKSYFSLPIVINDFDSVVFRKICNKFLKWFSIAKRNNSKTRKKKKRVCFCVAILFSSVKLQLSTGVFIFSFFLSNKQLFFKQQMAFFSNKWLFLQQQMAFFSNKWLFLALRKHSQISSQNTKLCFLLAHFFFNVFFLGAALQNQARGASRCSFLFLL